MQTVHIIIERLTLRVFSFVLFIYVNAKHKNTSAYDRD